jgi:hypothetical protein
MPDAAFTHTVRGFFGEELTIGAYPPEDDEDGGAVQFLIRDEHGKTTSAHISSPAEREAFAKAWMESCRLADAEPAAAEAMPSRVGEAPSVRTVTIPGSQQHEGFHSIRVTLPWTCPQCDGPRGEPFETTSYDGSRQLGCDGWKNPCGHVDGYPAVRREARALAEADDRARLDSFPDPDYPGDEAAVAGLLARGPER